MRLYLILVAIFFTTVEHLAAQSVAATPAAPAPRKVTVYLTADSRQLPGAEGADHRAEITMRDSVGGVMREFYPSGKTWRVIPFAHVEQGIRHGVATSFTEEGAMLTRQEFLGGFAEGQLLVYYPAGSMKSRTIYRHNEQVSAECFTAAGAPRPCPRDDTAPQYPGGEAALIGALLQKVKQPNESLQKTINGRTYVLTLAVIRLELQVDSLGAIAGAKVLEAPSSAWKAAVLKAVPGLKAFSPALYDGHAVAQSVVVPLTFPLDPRNAYMKPQLPPNNTSGPASVPREYQNMRMDAPSGGISR